MFFFSLLWFGHAAAHTDGLRFPFWLCSVLARDFCCFLPLTCAPADDRQRQQLRFQMNLFPERINKPECVSGRDSKAMTDRAVRD